MGIRSSDMTRERFIEGMDEAMDAVVYYSDPHTMGFPFSCLSVEDKLSLKARYLYEDLFNPTTNNRRTIWFDAYYEEREGSDELLSMRLTMMLLFVEHCLEHGDYREF